MSDYGKFNYSNTDADIVNEASFCFAYGILSHPATWCGRAQTERESGTWDHFSFVDGAGSQHFPWSLISAPEGKS